MRRAAGPALLACVAASLVALARQPPPAPAGFAASVARLSEPEGSFDTDNLISNERGYLDVMAALQALGVAGGAYLGVGPDQNFSYIARIRPSVAYIVDIRRDNLLLHLLFKALFARAPDRVSYLALLTGRSPPDGGGEWTKADAARIVGYIDRTPRAGPAAWDALRRDLDAALRGFGVPLSPRDLATVARFHEAFAAAGLDLRFNSHGRPPRPHYPTLRDLILARDRHGRAGHFLAAEADFRFVKALQARDGVVPVVGDVSGPHALAAIAREVAARRERVSAFYVSNVETYLTRAGAYSRFLANLELLPRDARSVMIRSMFGGASSASAVQPMHEMLGARGAR